MAYHGVLIPRAIKAMNVDSLNRSVVDAAAIDNGWIMVMGDRSTTAGLGEVFEVSQPATGSLTGVLWMAYSGDEIPVTDSRYKGIDPDPRNFYNIATKVFSAYKPAVGDIIEGTAECFGGSYSAGVSTHVNATDGAWGLTWGASQTSSVMSYKLVGTSYISLATGGIDNQRVTSYILECVAI